MVPISVYAEPSTKARKLGTRLPGRAGPISALAGEGFHLASLIHGSRGCISEATRRLGNSAKTRECRKNAFVPCASPRQVPAAISRDLHHMPAIDHRPQCHSKQMRRRPWIDQSTLSQRGSICFKLISNSLSSLLSLYLPCMDATASTRLAAWVDDANCSKGSNAQESVLMPQRFRLACIACDFVL